MAQFVEVGAYDAKTHFPEFLRKARAGVIFRITNRGEHVADLGPPGPTQRSDRVNAARVLIPRVKFHKTNCARGLEGLRAWSYEYSDDSKTFSSEPLHDWASHDGDGFSYGCQIMQMVAPPPPPEEPMRGITVPQTGATLDELWEMQPKRMERV